MTAMQRLFFGCIGAHQRSSVDRVPLAAAKWREPRRRRLRMSCDISAAEIMATSEGRTHAHERSRTWLQPRAIRTRSTRMHSFSQGIARARLERLRSIWHASNSVIDSGRAQIYMLIDRSRSAAYHLSPIDTDSQPFGEGRVVLLSGACIAQQLRYAMHMFGNLKNILNAYVVAVVRAGDNM